jgi:hypothetical protein
LPIWHGYEGSRHCTHVFVAGSQKVPPSAHSAAVQPGLAASASGPASLTGAPPEPELELGPVPGPTPPPIPPPEPLPKPPNWGKPQEAKIATSVATSAAGTTRKDRAIRLE